MVDPVQARSTRRAHRPAEELELFSAFADGRSSCSISQKLDVQFVKERRLGGVFVSLHGAWTTIVRGSKPC
jgi:hypothetical protein